MIQDSTSAAAEILNCVRDICAETIRVPLARVIPGARFIEDLDADSLFIVQLTIAVELCFDISISEEEARQLLTVQDMASFVAQRLGSV